MSILTKGEREYIQGNLIDGLKMRRGEGQDQALATICENFFQDALDTIDALEAERDAIHGIARARHNTTTVGGAHAALREILAIVEKNDSIRRVTCKCINGGETTINWRTGCGETLCHAELIDDEGGEL